MPTKTAGLVIAVMCLSVAPAHGQETQPALTPATQPTTQPVKFELSIATVAEGRAAIVDESTEPYFKLLQPLEIAAKNAVPVPGGDLATQQENCRKHYQDAVLDFTPDERDALRWYVSKIASYTYPKYPLLAATPWKFIKIADGIEGGNPFTRGQYICLSKFIAGDLTNEMHISVQGKADWTAMGSYAKVLLHEQMHVLQRSHPDLFAKFYTEQWGFVHAGSISTDPWLTEHQMLDPDAVDQRWVYPLKFGNETRWIVPRSILGNIANPGGPQFSDMQMVGIELKPGENGSYEVKNLQNLPAMTPLMNILPYATKFAPSQEIFHPNEISADLFAHVTLLLDIFPTMAPPVAAKALNKAREDFKQQHEAFIKLLSEK